MKKYILALVISFFICTPVYGATLTNNQINSIIGLLQAFGVSQTTITAVYSDLTVSQTQIQEVPIEAPQPVSTPSLDFGSVSTPPPVPTCTLLASTTNGTSFGSISWTSTNTTRGTIYAHQAHNSTWNAAIPLIPVESGYIDGIDFADLPYFEARFESPEGECIATTTLQ